MEMIAVTESLSPEANSIAPNFRQERQAGIPSQSLNKLWVIALLLTGSAENAENAVVESVSLRSDQIPVHGLIETCLKMTSDHSESSKDTVSMLPAELRPILQLHSPLRHCFVLRTLLGLSTHDCKRLLKISYADLRGRTVLAILNLSQLANGPLDHGDAVGRKQ